MAQQKISLIGEVLEENQKEILEFVANACLQEMRQRQLIPLDTGALQNDAYVKVMGDEVYIVFDKQYARRLYNGENFNFSKKSNINAQAQWDIPVLEDRNFMTNAMQYAIEHFLNNELKKRGLYE